MSWVLEFEETKKLDYFSLDEIGGKGYNLIKLLNKNVPKGLLIPTKTLLEFYKQKIEGKPLLEFIESKFEQLSENISDYEMVKSIGKELRETIENMKIESEEFLSQLDGKLSKIKKDLGDVYFAVRSSGTEEDSGEFSFAGQHDTYLNIKPDFQAILDHIKRCWASLFSDRALTYRFSHMKHFGNQVPTMCVVIQQMVSNVKYSGIMFTADPLTNCRNTITIDCSYGLGEALVSGLVSPDSYKVDKNFLKIKEKIISKKLVKIVSKDIGYVEKEDVPKDLQNVQALNDQLILKLAEIGKDVEKEYTTEQDIEFAIDEKDRIFILQSRPITSLFEVPHSLPFFDQESEKIPKNQYVLSFGHVQVMTEPIKPYGISLIESQFEKILPENSEIKHRAYSASGRVYLNISDISNSFLGRKFVGNMEKADQWMAKSTKKVTETNEFKENGPKLSFGNIITGIIIFLKVIYNLMKTFLCFKPKDVKEVFESLEKDSKSTIQNLNEDYKDSKEYFKKISENPFNIHEIFPKVYRFFIYVFLSINFLRYFIKQEWVDDLVTGIELKTNQMNHDLFELSQHITKPLLELLSSLKNKNLTSDELIDKIEKNLDEKEYRDFMIYFKEFIKEYGCRGLSEIDITQDRFDENVNFLISIITETNDHIKYQEKRKYLRENLMKAPEKILEEMKIQDKWKWWNIISCGIFGLIKRIFFSRLMSIYQTVFYYREHPKHFLMINLYSHKKKLLNMSKKEFSKLFQDSKDIFYLTQKEIFFLLDHKDYPVQKIIEKRKNDYKRYEKLTSVPRVINHTGESIDYQVFKEEMKNLAPNTLLGIGVATGETIGIVKIVLDPLNSIVKEGEIIVAKQIDPAFSALFRNCLALVSEVGGLMTHGSVVAREMNIPAVVGLVDATKKLKNGMKIKVNGTIGTVEIL